MKLPAKVLQGLAAVALAGISGCVPDTPPPANQQPPSSQQPTQPGVEQSGPAHENPGKLCIPDGCPGCGRG